MNKAFNKILFFSGILLIIIALVFGGFHLNEVKKKPVATKIQGLENIKTRKNNDGIPKFSEKNFGTPFTDENGLYHGKNGCSTYDDAIKSLTLVNKMVEKSKCVAESGKLMYEPYKSTFFEYSKEKPVYVDRKISLEDAWYSGAYKWDKKRRIDFANEFYNFLIISEDTKNLKKDKSIIDYSPKKSLSKCQLFSSYLNIKKNNQLDILESDLEKIKEKSRECGKRVNESFSKTE